MPLQWGQMPPALAAVMKLLLGFRDGLLMFRVSGVSGAGVVEVKGIRPHEMAQVSYGGIGTLADDFFLLNEYISASGHERLKKWSMHFGKLVLPSDEVKEIEAVADEQARTKKLVESVEPILEPLWSFFVALCHALQDGENELTAFDAYWLGLIDEVVGTELLSLRNFYEFQPDPPSPDAVNQPAEN